MKIAVIGAGGVGGYFGGKLANAGFDVTFIARGKHLEAIKQAGLKVKSRFGDFHVKPVNATADIKNINQADLIIVSVKAWQVKEIRDELARRIQPDTIILPLQNGILAAEELAERIDKKHIVGGLCRIFSKIESPGVIHHFGVEPTIVFGELDKNRTSRVEKIKQVLDTAGITSHISMDIEADLWRKFIAICAGGLMAVSRTTYGELRELQETRKMMVALLKEIYRISQKIGIDIENDFVDKTVAFFDSFPYESTTSLARDIWEGKPSEIDYQNGTVVNLGKRYGIKTPVNEFIYTCIIPMELKARRNS